VGVRGALTKRGDGALLLELEAPLARMAAAEELFARLGREAK
jgi:hypothetical protein